MQSWLMDKTSLAEKDAYDYMSECTESKASIMHPNSYYPYSTELFEIAASSNFVP